jgi:membrane fusion protein
MFRREAREAKETSWLGTIVLSRPLSTVVFTGATVAIVAGALAYLTWGEYTSKARVTGMLVPVAGVAKVQAAQSGVIVERLVAEGDRVVRGSAVLVIADTRQGAGSAELSRSVARQIEERILALEEQILHAGIAAEAEEAATARRREGLALEVVRLDREIAAIEERATLAGNEFERTRNLEERGFVSRSYSERRHDEVLDHRLRRHAAERSRLAAARELAALESESALARARSLAQASALRGQRAALAQERLERNASYRSTIAAPQTGTVATLLAETGQAVVPGTPLLTILPEGAELEAHLFIPSRSAGFIRAGQDVRLRFPAFPYQKFGAHPARITLVSRNALPASDLGLPAAEAGREPLYRVKAALASQAVAVYGRLEPLQAGMQVEADIQLDRRRLIEWIFEPLISLAGRT